MKHINTLYRQNMKLLLVYIMVRTVAGMCTGVHNGTTIGDMCTGVHNGSDRR